MRHRMSLPRTCILSDLHSQSCSYFYSYIFYPRLLCILPLILNEGMPKGRPQRNEDDCGYSMLQC